MLSDPPGSRVECRSTRTIPEAIFHFRVVTAGVAGRSTTRKLAAPSVISMVRSAGTPRNVCVVRLAGHVTVIPSTTSASPSPTCSTSELPP